MKSDKQAAALALVLDVLWIALLILPSATAASATRIFDANEYTSFAVSCWLVVGMRLLFPSRAFFACTLPIVLPGIARLTADHLRGVDLLALLLQWRTFAAPEVAGAARPHVWTALAGCAALAALCWACWRLVPARPGARWVRAGVLAATAALAAVVPATSWLRAWPLDGLRVVATTLSNSGVMALNLFPDSAAVDPRNPRARWNATRAEGASAQETVALVLGETIRTDFLDECHGPDRVRAVAAGAPVACDVTAGSDTTDHSVPLLVSRELPGHRARVSDDATVLHSLEEAGFEGHWTSAQAAAIAWPDATHPVSPNRQGLDTVVLSAPVAAALDGPAPLKTRWGPPAPTPSMQASDSSTTSSPNEPATRNRLS